MGAKRVPLIALAIFAIGVNAQTTPEADTTESTDLPPDDLTRQTGICRQCICKDDKVDCFDQSIEVFFKKDDWAAIAELPIQVLNLSRCNIEAIENASFKDLQEMQPTHVDLSENLFRNVTAIAELPIQVLNLSRCNIEAIENASFKDLQEMQGRYSPEEYEPLTEMRTLNLANNDLHSLNQDLFEHLPDLETLDLSGNPFTTIDHVTLIAISSLPRLKILRMRSCQLQDIPEKFLHTPLYLERLDLSDNQLTAVPQELEETKNLLYLNLNQNPIRLPPPPQAARTSHVQHAGSQVHRHWVPRRPRVATEAASQLQSSAVLYLQSNNLTEIDSRFLSRWDLVQKVDVSDNPFLCDCSTQWMVDILVPVIENKEGNATNMELHEYHRKMRCLDKYGHRPERDGSILLGTLIGVLLAVPIVLSLMLMWRRGYFSWLGLRPPVDVSRAFYKRAPADDNYI
ncbi:Leucine-rich transmembrane protein [Operophtera brumata]|uniref:Leucine-rich transmembrane protein n=1 Tax=Operophtera brumata TaxID=104452 RepID=A0A0L7KT86_OPEBR|nr:Leucine-rich transmembrane protein [Operophtera brumata]